LSSPSPDAPNDAPSDDASTHTDERTAETGRTAARASEFRSWTRPFERALAYIFGTVTVVSFVVLLALQIGPVSTWTAQFLASTFNPLESTSITIERASGTWVTSLQLDGVRLTRSDSTTGETVEMVRVDTLYARYQLTELLDQRLHVSRARVHGAKVTLRQAADSSWDWQQVLPAPTQDTTTSSFSIRLDDAQVTRSGVTAHFYSPGRDSTAGIRDLQVDLPEFIFDPTLDGLGVRARLDSLGLRASVPGEPTDVRFGTRLEIRPTALTLDTLALTSQRSTLTGRGQARLPSATGEPVDDVDLVIDAAPLSFLDLLPFLPTADLDPSEQLQGRLQVTGSGDQVTARLNARFRDGGSADLDATFTPRVSSPDTTTSLRYDVTADIQRLTTSLIGPADPSENRLTARIRADLEGPSLDRLGGSVAVDVLDTRYAPIQADSVRLRASMRSGETDYTVRGRVNGTGIDGSGTARLFDDRPSYRLDARFANLDAARFGGGALSTDVNGRIVIDGDGTDPQDLQSSLDLTLDASRIQDLNLTDGDARFRLSPDSVSGRVAIQTANGAIRLAGAASLDETERFRIDTARVDDIDVAAMMGDTTASRLRGTVQATGRGFSPETMRLDGQLTVTESFYGSVRLDSVGSRIALDRGRLRANVAAVVNDGTFAGTINGTPFESTPAVDIQEGRFERVNIGSWLADSGYTSDLNGTFEATVQGLKPERLRADGRIRLDSSSINRAEVRDAVFDASIGRGRATVATSLTTAEGTSELALTARPFASIPTVTITTGRIRGLDVGAVAAIEGLNTSLNGSVSGSARGQTLADLSGNVRVRLRESSINRAPVDRGTFSVEADSGRAHLRMDADLAGGSLRADGRLNAYRRVQSPAGEDVPADSTTLNLAVEAAALNLSALAGDDSLNASIDSLRLTFDGAGTSLAELRAETQLSARDIRAADLRIRDVTVRGLVEDGFLQVDTLRAQSNAFDATGGGTIALTATGNAQSDFRFTGRLRSLQPLQRLAGAQTLDAQSAEIDGRIYGAPGALRANLEGRLESLSYDNIRVANAEIRAAGMQGDTTLVDRFEMAARVDFFSLSAFRVEQTQLQVNYDSARADIDLMAKIDAQRNLSIDATLNPFSSPQRLTLNAFDATLDESKWELLQTASVTLGDAYRVNGLLLYSDDQQIAADGRIDPDGTQSLVATIERFEVASISDLAGFDGLGGTLNGTIGISGPAHAPVWSGNLNMDVVSNDEPVGDLDLELSYDSLRLDTDATLTHSSGRSLQAGGSLPVDLRLDATDDVDISAEPVDLTVSGSRFPIDWVDPFLDPALITDPTGLLSADLNVKGTLGTPELSGSATLEDGRVSVTDLDVRYRNASASLRFSGEEIVLDRASVDDDSGGRLNANGRINLTELTLGEYDLDLDASNFTAIDTRAFNKVRLNGDLEVTGTTDSPVVNGRVTIIQGDIYYAETLSDAEAADLATVQLNEDDQRLLERRFGVRLSKADTTTFDTYEALAMDLSVNIRRDTWLRSRANPELNIQFTGTLDVQKEPFDDARVFGAIDVVPERSTVRQFGQEFQIQEGVLSFNGDPAEPYLNFTAVYQKQSRTTNSTEVEITLSAQGRPEDLDLSLSSQPQMDTRNILSYLATGQPADQLLSGGGNGTGDLAENLAIGQLTSLAENFATSNVGLDVVRIQYQPNGGSYFVLGRYVTPRFYVAIEQPVAADQSQAQNVSSLAPDLTLEYELTDNLLMRAQSRQQSLRFNLLFEYAY